jgi:hypothetical protein
MRAESGGAEKERGARDVNFETVHFETVAR